jgi:predicted dehydrogenase
MPKPCASARPTASCSKPSWYGFIRNGCAPATSSAPASWARCAPSMPSSPTSNRRPGNNVRNQADIGGGGIMDIGCYPITAARFLFEARAEAASSRSSSAMPVSSTDRLASVLADFGNGQAAQLHLLPPRPCRPPEACRCWAARASLRSSFPSMPAQGERTAITIDTGALHRWLAGPPRSLAGIRSIHRAGRSLRSGRAGREAACPGALRMPSPR